MNLNGSAAKLGEPYEAFDGQLRLFMIPYHTFKMRIVYKRLEEADYGDEYSHAISCYTLPVGSLAKCELLVDEDTLTDEARSFWVYYTNRKGTVIEDFEWFMECVAFEAIVDLHKAYDATRRQLPQAPEALQENRPEKEADPKGSSAGRKRGKAKSSR